MITTDKEFEEIENEIWANIRNYEGLYKVSNMGRVKSLNRFITRINNKGESIVNLNSVILKQSKTRGYLCVSLCSNGVSKKKPIHKLVAMAFLGHIQCGYNEVINHIDQNKLNNRADNLEITTNRDNVSKSFLSKKTSSNYTGVCWDNSSNNYKSAIRIKKSINLGRSNCELKAAYIYNIALKNIDKFNGNHKEFREYIRSIINDRQHNFRRKNI